MTAVEFTKRLREMSDEEFVVFLRTPKPFEPAYNQAAIVLAETKRRGMA